MPIKQLADGRWDVAICVNRRRVHRRLPAGTSASEARQFERELAAAIGRKAPTIPGDPLLTDLMAGYLRHADSLRAPGPAKYAALRAGEWVKGHRASSARQVAAAMVRDMTGHYKPATINKTLGTLKKALRLAWDQGLTPVNHGDAIRLLPENNIRTRTLTLREVQQLADAASEQVRAAIWISVYTGCRRGEVVGIKAGDIQADHIMLRAGQTKTGRHRAVPIIAPLRPWLKFLPLLICARGIESGFRDARIKAGLPDVTFHDLRRTAGTLMVEAGAPLHVVSKLLGHTSPRVTAERYAHLHLDTVREWLGRAHEITHAA